MSRPSLEDLEVAFHNATFLRQLALQLCGSKHQDADDLLQETWLVAQQHPPAENSALGNWFARVLRSRASERRRSEGRRTRRERVAARGESVADGSDLEKLEIQRKLMEHLITLQPDHRQVLYLRYFENLAPRAIAEKLDTPVTTIRTRLQRALEELRQRLDRESSGDRGQWVSALAPLLPPPQAASGAGLTPAASVAAPIVMKKWTLTLAALSLLLVGGVYFALQSDSAGVDPDTENQTLVSASTGTKASPADPTIQPDSQKTTRQLIATTETKGNSLGSLLVTLKSESGQPLPDVEMEFRASLPGVSRQELLLHDTDSSGQVRIEGLVPGEVWVATSTFWSATKITIAPGKETTLDFVLPPANTIEFSVTDESGRTVPGAEIWGEPKFSRWSTLRKIGVTNGAGELVVGNVGPHAIFGARAKGHVASPTLQVEALPAGSPGRLKAALVLGPPGGTCHGLVLDPDGQPVEGATVVAGTRGGFGVTQKDGSHATAPKPAQVHTDASGQFVLPNDLPGGAHPVWVTAPGWPAWSGTVNISPGTNQRIEVQLTPGGTLEGQLVDSHGQPVALGRVLVAKEINGGWYHHSVPPPSAITDETGHFRIEGVPAGLQEVNATAHWEEKNRGKARMEYESLPNTVTQTKLALDLGMIISGRLVDQAGNPVPDWRVNARGVNVMGNVYPRSATTDESGAFLIPNLGPGARDLAFFQKGSYTHPLAKVPGVEAGTLDLVVTVDRTKVPNAWIEGVLGATTDDGTAIAPNARLLLKKSDSNRGHYVTFDPDSGRFRHGPISAGRYQLQIAHDMRVLFSGEWFDIQSGETKTVGVLNMVPLGSLTLNLDGVPTNAQAGLYLALDREGMATQKLNYVDGHFTANELVPGRWLLSGRAEPWFIPSTWVDIQSEKQTQLDITAVMGQENSVFLRIDPPDSSWEWVRVEVKDSLGELVFVSPKYSQASAKDDRVYLSGFDAPAGSYTLRAQTDSGLGGDFPLELDQTRSEIEIVLR